MPTLSYGGGGGVVVSTPGKAPASTEPQPGPAESVEQAPPTDGHFQLVVLVSGVIARAAFLSHVESFKVSIRVMDHWCKHPSAWATLPVAERKDHAVTAQGNGAYCQWTQCEPSDSSSTFGRVEPASTGTTA
ncbi:uncharacterized protein LOC144153266 [Haemaphysalis longicornis]